MIRLACIFFLALSLSVGSASARDFILQGESFSRSKTHLVQPEMRRSSKSRSFSKRSSWFGTSLIVGVGALVWYIRRRRED